jgi:hypothetical protein
MAVTVKTAGPYKNIPSAGTVVKKDGAKSVRQVVVKQLYKSASFSNTGGTGVRSTPKLLVDKRCMSISSPLVSPTAKDSFSRLKRVAGATLLKVKEPRAPEPLDRKSLTYGRSNCPGKFS